MDSSVQLGRPPTTTVIAGKRPKGRRQFLNYIPNDIVEAHELIGGEKLEWLTVSKDVISITIRRGLMGRSNASRGLPSL